MDIVFDAKDIIRITPDFKKCTITFELRYKYEPDILQCEDVEHTKLVWESIEKQILN